MKKKLIYQLKTIGGIWLLGTLLALVGCYDVINAPEGNNQFAPSGAKGRVLLSIGEGQGNARTLVPTETPVFSKYDLTFTAGGKTTVNRSLTTDTDKNSLNGAGYSLELESAIWTVTATAYTGTQAAASGTTTLTVNAGGTSSVNISLAPLDIADGKQGTFSWNFTTSGITGGISGRTVTLTPVKNGVSGISISLDNNSGNREMESGYYNLVVQFEKTVSGTAFKAGIYEAVHIYPGLTTKAAHAFTDADFTAKKILAGTVNITPTTLGTVDYVTVQAHKDERCTDPVSTEVIAQSSPWNWLLEVPSESVDLWFKITVKLDSPSNIYIAKVKLEESIPLEGKVGISLDAVIGTANPPSDFTWSTSNGNITISNYNGLYSSVVVIPRSIDDKPVVTIGNSAFRGNYLINVIIPDSVTSIGESAFAANELTSVTIPGAVASIGNGAFTNNQLTSVSIPNSVTSIGDYTFWHNQLTSVFIPSSVTSIGVQAFSENQLTSVSIPNSVTSIGYSAFSRNKLTSVSIPNSVTSIGDAVFTNNQLTSVSIPNSVISIGEFAFSGNELTSVSIPNSVTSIGRGAFAANQLTSVSIPGSVTSIDNEAFSDNQLTSVSIPNSVTSIGGSFTNNQLTSVSIPNSVTSIGGSFTNNQLTSVTIPSSVTYIGGAAFTNNQLTSVSIGADVDIYSSSFDGNLKEAYDNNGKQGGTYTRADQSSPWVYRQ